MAAACADVVHRPPPTLQASLPPTLPPSRARAMPMFPIEGAELELGPEQKSAQAALLKAAQAALGRGAYELAEHAFHEAALLDPADVEARLGLGRIWLMRGVAADDASDLARARQAFAQVLARCPDHPQARRLLALLPLVDGPLSPEPASR